MPQDRRPSRARRLPRPSPVLRPPRVHRSRCSACPLGLTLALLALTALPRINGNRSLALAFWVAGGGLLVWQAVLALRAGRAGLPGFVHVPPRPQHYIQMCCHLSVYAYWG